MCVEPRQITSICRGLFGFGELKYVEIPLRLQALLGLLYDDAGRLPGSDVAETVQKLSAL